MGRYRLVVIVFAAVIALCALVGSIFANDPIAVLTVLAAVGASTLSIVFVVISAQRKIERAIGGGSIDDGGSDREYQRELRIAEVITRDMPEAHAEQLIRAFSARADRIELLIKERAAADHN